MEIWSEVIFEDLWPGPNRQSAILTSDDIGFDINREIGSYITAGQMGKEPFESLVHDYGEIMVLVGTDTNEMSKLWAEIEFCLGPEKERHVICSASAVFILKGVPHYPAMITRMARPSLIMNISVTRSIESKPVFRPWIIGQACILVRGL